MAGYSLGIKELDDLIGEIREGTNLMIIGPPMSGKDDILNTIIYGGLKRKDSAIIVSTKEPGERILEWFSEKGLEIPLTHIGIVDCVTRTLGMPVPDTQNIRRVSSPVDLTGIGVKISQFFEEFFINKKHERTRMCMNSLSTILMYSNIQTLFRFLHVFTGRVKAAKALGIYVVEDEMHDPQTVATLKQLFDGMLEIRSDGDNHRIRVVGLSSKPTPWFDYEIDGVNIVLKRSD